MIVLNPNSRLLPDCLRDHRCHRRQVIVGIVVAWFRCRLVVVLRAHRQKAGCDVIEMGWWVKLGGDGLV